MTDNDHGTGPHARATWSVNQLIESDRADLVDGLVEDLGADLRADPGAGPAHQEVPVPVQRGRLAGHRVALHRAALRRGALRRSRSG